MEKLDKGEKGKGEKGEKGLVGRAREKQGASGKRKVKKGIVDFKVKVFQEELEYALAKETKVNL